MLRITWGGMGDYNDRRIEVFEVLELVGLGVEDAVCVHVCVRVHMCVHPLECRVRPAA